MNNLPREKQIEVIAALCEGVGIGQLVDAALALAPAIPTETPPDRRRAFTVIQGGKA